MIVILIGGSLNTFSVFFSDGRLVYVLNLLYKLCQQVHCHRNIAVAEDSQLRVYDATVGLDQTPSIINLGKLWDSCISPFITVHTFIS